MMKETYERTEIVVTEFEPDDVIATSGFPSRFFFTTDEYEGHVIEER